MQWIKSGDYLKSDYSFKIPKTLFDSEYQHYKNYQGFRQMFESTVAQAMDIWIMLNIPFTVA